MNDELKSTPSISEAERQLIEQEMERASILMKANEVKEETLDLGLDGQVEFKNELADMMMEAIDNPDEKYSNYYKVIKRLLEKHLPKGKEYEASRKLIYEEKNTFLTRGHRLKKDGTRGADGRMAYNPDMQELIEVITDWLSSRGTMWDIYTRLRDLNKSKGYPMD